MVLSIARAKWRAEARLRPVGHDERPKGDIDLRPGWPSERGATRWEATGDVGGGFPGYALRGARLERATIRVTDRYLLVDEGRPFGFGLPIGQLIDARVAEEANGAGGEPVVHLAYHDGYLRRTFALRFRGSLLGLRGAHLNERALTALSEVGVATEIERRPLAPSLTVPWPAATTFHEENVIWSGRANVSHGMGLDRVAADVWLSTRSLMWGGPTGDGICRLPLDAIHDLVVGGLEDRFGTPAVYLAHGPVDGPRFDLAFVFDSYHHRERDRRERGAFLVGLRSRGILLGSGAAPTQPWRLDIRPPVTLRSLPPGVAGAMPDPLRPATPHAHSSSPRPDRVASPARSRAVDAPATQPVDPNLTTSGVAPDPAGARSTALEASAGPVAAVGPALPETRAYEAAALAAMAATLDAFRAVAEGRAHRSIAPAPSASALHGALTELDQAVAEQQITAPEMGIRRARLRALGDAVPRLKSLLELRGAGYLSDADLARKRATILAPLARQIFGPE